MSDPVEIVAEVQPPLPRKKPGKSLWYHLFIEFNPFYLLSAACMLGSCLALTNSLSWNPIAIRRLFILIITLNLYEAAVLAIAIYLIIHRHLPRDGKILLVLQAFFLVDFAYLNAEIATIGEWMGIATNAVLLVLAVVKLWIVVKYLKPDFTPAQFGFVIFQLAMLFATPCVLHMAELHRYKIGPKHFYLLWWIAGMIPAMYELLAHFDLRNPRTALARATGTGCIPFIAITRAQANQPAGAAPTYCWLALPYVAFLTHLGILQYVYNVGYYGANAAPVLLGLTLVLNRFSPSSFFPRKDLLTLRLVLPLAAVLVSLNNPFTFHADLRYPDFSVSPLNLAIAGAFLLYVYMFLRAHAKIFLATGAAIAAVYVFGPSRAKVLGWLRDSWEQNLKALDKLTPRTLADWGVIGLVASFVLLGIGFWFSLMKRPHAPVVEDRPKES